MKLAGLLLIAAGVAVAPAYSEVQYGAKLTHRYGETRAAFIDVLARSDKDDAC